MICIFLFYDKGIGKPRKYAFGQYKHCNVICFDGRDFVIVELGSKGLMTRVIKSKSAVSIIKKIKIIKTLAALVAVNITKEFKFAWSPLWLKSCNEVCRYAAGINIGMTIMPIHLHKKLLKLNNKRNFEIIYEWKR